MLKQITLVNTSHETNEIKYEPRKQRNRAIDTLAATLEVFETSRPQDLELFAWNRGDELSFGDKKQLY